MILECSAIIPDKTERTAIRDNFVRRFAYSYGDHEEMQKLFATYVGEDEAVIDAFIQTFEKYPEHSIKKYPDERR